MIDGGWIKIWRQSVDSAVFQDPDLWRLWTLCLMLANHAPKQYFVNGMKEPIIIKAGQFVTGRYDLYHKLYPKKSRKSVSPLTLSRMLTRLQTLENLNIKTNNRFTLVTICNWEKYQNTELQNEQQNEQQLNNSWTTVEHKQELKNEKNKDNTPYSPPFEDFWKAYPRKAGKAQAVKAWNKIKPDVETSDAIITAIEKQIKADILDLRDNMKFCPHPATWLNQRRWEDEIEPDPEKPQPKPVPQEDDTEERNAYLTEMRERYRKENEHFNHIVIQPLKEEINEHAWTAFIEPLVVVGKTETTLTLFSSEPNFVTDHYKSRIEEKLQNSNVRAKAIVLTARIKAKQKLQNTS